MDLNLLVAVLLGSAVLVGAIWLVRRIREVADDKVSDDRIDTVIGWPPKATRVLTTSETLSRDILVRALPEYMVLAQVPLARFLKVPTRNSYSEWLRRLGAQCADLVVCDKSSQVIAVVDVQAPADQASERSRKRLNRMARVLKAAEIPLHVWTEGVLPSVEAARTTLLARVPMPPASATAPAAPAVPVPAAAPRATEAANPFEDQDRDASDDEVIEAREPPPSTWFDEFNSGPGGLGKPIKPGPRKP